MLLRYTKLADLYVACNACPNNLSSSIHTIDVTKNQGGGLRENRKTKKDTRR